MEYTFQFSGHSLNRGPQGQYCVVADLIAYLHLDLNPLPLLSDLSTPLTVVNKLPQQIKCATYISILYRLYRIFYGQV